MFLSRVEALIIASPEPLAAKKIAAMYDEITPSKVAKAVADLNSRYLQADCSFRIREIAGGYQFYIMPEFTGYVEDMFARTRKMRLTRAALETMAIIAYKQPVTKTEIEQIRGVASDGVIQNLLEKKMITIKGRAETVGKPLMYGTTDEFLSFFGINALSDLPKMSEIEAMVAAVDKENQTQLRFENEEDEDIVKLNIADGTYKPEADESETELDEPVADSEHLGEPLPTASEPSEAELVEIEKEDASVENGIIIDIDRT